VVADAVALTRQYRSPAGRAVVGADCLLTVVLVHTVLSKEAEVETWML
jgi:hypothetical protein